MPRTISAELKTHFQSGNVTPGYLAKLTRRDGEVMGFSSIDFPFSFEGVNYEPSNTLAPSQIRTSEGTGVDTLDIQGIISSDAITDVDIRAGRYDAATVDLMVVNWDDLTQGKLTLLSGYFGEIGFQEGSWKAEIRSLFTRIAAQVGELTCAGCRVKVLGDARCKFVLIDGTHVNTKDVDVNTSSTTIVFASDGNATDFYTYGTVELTEGDNAGIVRAIKSHTLVSGKAQLLLQEAFPFAVTAGTEGILTVGCRRTIPDCRDKFSNVINYVGEPWLPGTDTMIQSGARA